MIYPEHSTGVLRIHTLASRVSYLVINILVNYIHPYTFQTLTSFVTLKHLEKKKKITGNSIAMHQVKPLPASRRGTSSRPLIQLPAKGLVKQQRMAQAC